MRRAYLIAASLVAALWCTALAASSEPVTARVTYVTGASVYAFAIVLAVFLFGIGLGSRQIAPRLARARDPSRAGHRAQARHRPGARPGVRPRWSGDEGGR